MMAIEEAREANVPNQLVSAEDKGTADEDDVNEFCGVGGGAIGGYTAPLGMDPDALGRKKNRPKRK